MRSLCCGFRALAAVTVAGLLVLTGCSEHTMTDLNRYVADVSQRKASPPESLPPMKPYDVFLYSPTERDPFRPFFQQQREEQPDQEGDGGIKPDFNRNREELESYPLDSLRMVGTMEREEDVWAIVLDSDATVHRVQVGNYVGQNHGKVVNIQEDRMELVEIARDARGRWQERPATIALIEQE